MLAAMRYTLWLVGLWLPWMAMAEPALTEFDFTRSETCLEWQPAHDLKDFHPSSEGLSMTITGRDPYFVGPAHDYPAETPFWLHLRIKSETGGQGQVFFYKDQPSEEASVGFHVQSASWTDVRMPFPPLGRGYHLRVDPPGERGTVVIASLRFARRLSPTGPAWPKCEKATLTRPLRLSSGNTTVSVAPEGFELSVDGLPMAASHPTPMIGYAVNDETRWINLSRSNVTAFVEDHGDVISRTVEARDSGGGHWMLHTRFGLGATPGVIDYECTLTTDRDRTAVFLPMLLMVAGRDTFGTNKNQALFSGLEYLENEPSSSEADLVGPESRRQIPANHKITLPLMVIQAREHYVGVIWDQAPDFCALFDSPDRTTLSGGHLMGVLFPGCDGQNRQEGALVPYEGMPLRAGQPVVLHAQLIGGQGESVVPAVKQFVAVRGLPPVPKLDYALPEYAKLAAQGWLDSKIREGNRFHHAVWPGFAAAPAADAAMFMHWLKERTEDDALRSRLDETEQAALAVVDPAARNSASISHLRYPVASLVYGGVADNAKRARQEATALLGRFQTNGLMYYHAPKTGEDYGRTHFARHANGMTGQVVANLLEAASLSGEPELIRAALEKLRGLGVYHNSVPRGAQTWEIPLHSPDILASAYMARAYLTGYILTSDPHFLDEARYWAWTGLPFVYLVSPMGTEAGPYGTIAVLGATGWRSPVWMGRPVQWCGMVYADVLFNLAQYDATGPWKKLAEAITTVGIHYTWPATDQDRVGLLPDVFDPLTLERSGPAINPGTVQAGAVRLYGSPAFYTMRVCPPLILHAPGDVDSLEHHGKTIQFQVRTWLNSPYFLLINGVPEKAILSVNGRKVTLEPPHEYNAQLRQCILRVEGDPKVEIDLND